MPFDRRCRRTLPSSAWRTPMQFSDAVSLGRLLSIVSLRLRRGCCVESEKAVFPMDNLQLRDEARTGASRVAPLHDDPDHVSTHARSEAFDVGDPEGARHLLEGVAIRSALAPRATRRVARSGVTSCWSIGHAAPLPKRR